MKTKGRLLIIICFLLALSIITQTPEILEKPLVLGETLPDFQPQGEILINQENGQTLYSQNENTRFYPASTTKILTALVVLENEDLDQVITVGDEINLLLPDSSRAGLYVGEQISVRELLYALMLPSGNDAAYTLAVSLGRSLNKDESMDTGEAIKAFTALMNQTAQELGARHSNFMNPDGYHHPDHYTTAWDMALIARKAMQNKDFQTIVQSRTHPAPKGTVINQQPVQNWENSNRLLNPDDPFYFADSTGIKTGHTTQAGYCLVSSASRQGRNLLAVVFNSTETGVLSSSAKLLEYGFSIDQSVFEPKQPVEKPSEETPYLKYLLIIIGFICLYRLLLHRPKPRRRR